MAENGAGANALDGLPLALTVREAARALRGSATTAYDQANLWLESDGAEGLPVVRLGRVLRVPRVAVERLLLISDGGEMSFRCPRAMVVERPDTFSPPCRGSTLAPLPGCRELRRALGAMAWAVFEDVAHDVIAKEGGLVAATSPRLVADHLGITPGTAASAMRRLREAGLLSHERQTGAGGRFGLSAYRVHLPVAVAITSCANEPHVQRPHVTEPRAVDRHMEDASPRRRSTHTELSSDGAHQLNLFGNGDAR